MLYLCMLYIFMFFFLYLMVNKVHYIFYNMVNFGPLAVEIGSLVWGTPANFNGLRVFSALLHVHCTAL